MDTAAEVNVIGGEDLRKFGKVRVGSDRVHLGAADGTSFEHNGIVEVHLRHGDRMEVATACIVKGEVNPSAFKD